MKIYAISDLHLSFKTDKPMDLFGGHWTGYEDKILADWNSKLGSNDIGVIAGDISWAMKMSEAEDDFAFLKKLNGRKIIIRGNHDYWWSSIGKVREALGEDVIALQNDAVRFDGNGMKSVEKAPSKKTNKALDMDGLSKSFKALAGNSAIVINECSADDPDKRCRKCNDKIASGEMIGKPSDVGGIVFAGTRGWKVLERKQVQKDDDKKIFDREVLRLELALQDAVVKKKDGDKLVVIIHYPPFNAMRDDSAFTQMMEEYKVDICIYGHLHGKGGRKELETIKNGIKYYLTSCDLLDFRVAEIEV